MKNKNILSVIATFILLAVVSNVSAQTATVSGQIIDAGSKASLPSATVFLNNTDDATIKFAERTNLDGEFAITNVPSGNYTLTATYVGYTDFKKSITINSSDVQLGKLPISSKNNVLSQVQVKGGVASVQQKGDTTQYNAGSYKTNPDANAEDLLGKMPGMQVKDGKLQNQGENVAKVLVDGQPFFGDDPNAALKNLPASIINKIEVFDEQSEQSKFTGFDDGNTTKTINIVTKAEFRNGTFGNVYAGYGTDNKYAAGAVINKFKDAQRITILGQSNNINQQNFSTSDLSGVMSNSGGGRGGRGGRGGGRQSAGGSVNDFLVGSQNGITNTNAIGLNYSNKWNTKTNVNTSYFFNKSANNASSILTQQYFSTMGDGQVYKENQDALTDNINHRFNVRLTHDLNENNSFIFMPSFTIQKNNGMSNLSGQTTLGNSLLSSTSNLFNSEIDAWNFSNTALWRHKFAKRGRTFSVGLTQKISQNDASSLLQATNDFENASASDVYNQEAGLDQFEQTYSARIEYTEPLKENIGLQFKYNPSVSLNQADKQTMNYDASNETYSIIDSALSNISDNTYIAHNAGVGLRIRQGNQNLGLSLDVQTAEQRIAQTIPYALNQSMSYQNILPSVFWRYKISKDKNINVMYRTSTTAPSITQLQEVLNNSNPIQLTIGNANLDQQYQHSLRARYSATNFEKSTMFFAMLNGSYINNYIGTTTIIANTALTTDDGIYLNQGTQLRQQENFDNYYSLRGMVTYGMPIKKLKSNLNLSLSGNLNHIPGMINNEMNYVDNPSAELGVVLSSNISKNIDFTVGSTSSINYTFNSLNEKLNNQYFNQSSTAKLYWNFYKGFTFRTDATHQYYKGLDSDFNTNYTLWNASLGYKFLKDNKAEVILSAFDILNENNSVSRTVTQSYTQDLQTQVLKRYGMLTFRYNLQRFGAGK